MWASSVPAHRVSNTIAMMFELDQLLICYKALAMMYLDMTSLYSFLELWKQLKLSKIPRQTLRWDAK